ncbi:MAG: hypothetical protein WAM18_07260 [Halobacillus sp.]|uniref:hypothetical protein n=1 Tax=Halobacillus sp. TaxID=56800 RepID=UPI003BB1323C
MLEYFVLLPLMVVVFYYLYMAAVFPNFITYAGYAYFLILTLVFVILRERIKSNYDLESVTYWEKNSVLVDTMMWLYIIPGFALIIFALVYWFKGKEGRRYKQIIASVIGLILFFIYNYAIFELFLGYSR